MGRLRTVYMPLSELLPADRNAKDHDHEIIGASMDRFGYMEPVLLDERTGKLIAGHGRTERLVTKRDAGEAPPENIIVKGGEWMVPVTHGWSSADDAEAEAAGIAINRATEAGGWKPETLTAMLSELAALPRGLEGLGYSQANLDDLLHQEDVRGKRRQVDPDFIPIPMPKPVTQPGDLWVMGEHRVLCGDSTNVEDVRRVLDGESIDFAFTSPPYNVGVEYEDNDDALADLAYESLLRGVIESTVDGLAPGRLLGWNIGALPKLRPTMHMVLLEEAGLTFVRQCIWDKVSLPLPTYYRTREAGRVRFYYPNPRHEMVWLMSKGKVEPGDAGDFDEELMRDDVIRMTSTAATRDLWSEPGTQTTIGSAKAWRLSGGSVGKVHPAPFPVALPEGFIGYLADRGAIVFDPFAGSGSTIIAAHRTGRRGFGVELSPQYCDVIAERYQRVTEDLPVLRRGRGQKGNGPVDFLARRSERETTAAS